MIKRFYRKNNGSLSNEDMIKNLLNIFYQYNRNATPTVISSLLKLMLHCNSQQHNVLLIWQDIQTSIINHLNVNKNNDIGHLCSLWLKCCIESNKVDMGFSRIS